MLYSYMLVTFAFVFWIIRISIALMANMGVNFIIAPFNNTIEIILLFVTIICLALIMKRKMLGALVYMLSHVLYFGYGIANNISNASSMEDYFSILIASIGIILPLLIFLDIGLTKKGKTTKATKKTDWFYQNENYDRKFDERADRNQYKF